MDSDQEQDLNHFEESKKEEFLTGEILKQTYIYFQFIFTSIKINYYPKNKKQKGPYFTSISSSFSIS